MAISLYDVCVPSYLQVLGAVTGILQKGAQYAAASDLDVAELVETRLHSDMHPLSFQVVSVVHHSLGAIRGVEAGEFNPPPSMPDPTYAALEDLVRQANGELRAIDREAVDGLAGKHMLFKAGKFEAPFTAENFILSFSLPNFYFHAATTYDLLRMAGVPLGKMDFLGNLRVGT